MTDHIAPDDRSPPAGDLTDERLDALLRGARDHYNVPRTMPPLDTMWERIEHDAFGTAEVEPSRDVLPLRTRRNRITRALRNYGTWAGLAAGLVLGVMVGRYAMHPSGALVTADAGGGTPGAEAASPVDLETARYLGQTAALLVSLPAEHRVIDANFADRARQLLGTTRLLLDVASEPETRALLEDLELVLAQIVGLETSNRREELELITQALEQRELLPRLHSAVNAGPASSAD